MNKGETMSIMLSYLRALVVGALCAGAGVWAQDAGRGHHGPSNQLGLMASASVEAPQDWLTMTLGTSRDGADAQTVQQQLKQVVASALATAKPFAQSGTLEVRSGNFNVYPRYGRDGKISGWQGSSDVVIEGKDFARMGELAARMQGLAVRQLQFSLSTQSRQQAEAQAQGRAIEAFQAKALQAARAFGFSGYSLREVSIQAQDALLVPRPRMMSMAKASASADEAVPLEAGKSTVTVTVTGSVQLR
jgi:predicted secreted protein